MGEGVFLGRGLVWVEGWFGRLYSEVWFERLYTESSMLDWNSYPFPRWTKPPKEFLFTSLEIKLPYHVGHTYRPIIAISLTSIISFPPSIYNQISFKTPLINPYQAAIRCLIRTGFSETEARWMNRGLCARLSRIFFLLG